MSRIRLEEIEMFGVKRAERAEEKLRAAQAEVAAATEALAVSRRNLSAWDAANPDPQLSLIDAINSKGDQA